MPNDRSRSPLSYDMGHGIVLNIENLCPKRKVRTHVFSAVTAKDLAVKRVNGTVAGRCFCGF